MTEKTKARLTWQGDLRFEAEAASGHKVDLDSTSRPGYQGASPMELMLIGIAGCTAMDIVAILRKMREPIAGLEVAVSGDRAPTNPKYFTHLELTYRIRGEGLSRAKVDRAVDLSLSTYCSAVASLRPECRVSTVVDIVPA